MRRATSGTDPETAADGTAVDGRRARRERGRTAVVDAVFALLREGHLPPSVDDVAARAGVSVSSVFRYFDSLDDLHRHTIERYFDRFSPRFEVPAAGEGPRDERIVRYVDARLDLFDVIGPIARIARMRAPEHPRVAASLHRTRSLLADMVTAQFGPELRARTAARADDLAALVDSLTSFEAWDLLTEHRGRTRAQVRRAWITALTALCADT